MSGKYKLVKDDFITYKGRKLYRIKALRDLLFANNRYVNEGELGGYVEGYHNLSQEGSCWIYDDAKVYGNAVIKDDALVEEDAEVYGNAVMKGRAQLHDFSQLFGNARIEGDVTLYGHAKIYGNAVLNHYVNCFNDSEVFGNVVMRSSPVIKGYAVIRDNAMIWAKATTITGLSEVNGNSEILSKAYVNGSHIYDNAVIKNWDVDELDIIACSNINCNIRLTTSLCHCNLSDVINSISINQLE